MDINVVMAKALESANKTYQTALAKIPPNREYFPIQASPKCGGFGKNINLEIDNDVFGPIVEYCYRTGQCEIGYIYHDIAHFSLRLKGSSDKIDCIKPQIMAYKQFVTKYNKASGYLPSIILSGNLTGNVDMLKEDKKGHLTPFSKKINIFLK